MNLVASLCRRLFLNEPVTSVPVYSTASGTFLLLQCWELYFPYFSKLVAAGFNNISTTLNIAASGGGLSLAFMRFATKKTAGSTKNGRDSKPKNLAVKKFGGEKVIPGNIIVRQRGTRFHPGDYVGMGKDHTLYALKEGHVKFERHKLSGHKWVHVEPKDWRLLHTIRSGAVAAAVLLLCS